MNANKFTSEEDETCSVAKTWPHLRLYFTRFLYHQRSNVLQ